MKNFQNHNERRSNENLQTLMILQNAIRSVKQTYIRYWLKPFGNDQLLVK